MRVVDYPKEIKESVTELSDLLKQQSHAKLRVRCQVLLWLKTEKVSTMKQAMELQGYSTSQGQNWWKQYKSGGIAEFLSLRYSPQVSPLSGEPAFEARLKEGFESLQQGVDWVKEHLGLEYSTAGFWRYLNRRKVKLKTGRPTHPKRDAQKRQAYKKNTRKK